MMNFGYISKNFEYKIDHISKAKYYKIIFFIGFRTLHNFLNKNPIWLLLRGDVCMSLTKKNQKMYIC